MKKAILILILMGIVIWACNDEPGDYPRQNPIDTTVVIIDTTGTIDTTGH